MKTTKTLIYFIAFVFGSSLMHAQSWKWGATGRPVDLSCYPLQESFGTVQSVASDLKDNVFETGYFDDTIHFGAYKIYSRDKKGPCPLDLYSVNPFLLKYDSSGNILWAKQGVCPGISEGWAKSVATDDSGNVYETGYFTDTISFGAIMLYYTSRPGYATGGYLVKYNAAGNVVWAKQFTKNANASSVSEGFGLATDGHKYLYLTGMFQDTIAFGTDTLKTTPQNRGADVFLAKFDFNGNIIWAKQSEVHIGYGYGLSVALDQADNSYITGYFADSISFGPYAFGNHGFSSIAAFVAKYDANGNVLWARKAYNTGDTTGYSQGNAVVADGSGSSYVTGYFEKRLTLGSYTLNSDSADIFLAKYNSNGNVVWVIKGNQLDSSNWYGNGLAIDALYHLYLASNVFNITYYPAYYKIAFGTDTFKLPSTGNSIITEFDTSGKALCGSYIPYAGNGGGSPSVSSDPSGTCIYTGISLGGGANDTAIYGSDRLTFFGTPCVARWKSCVINTSRTGIPEIKTNIAMNVYPNPFTNITTVAVTTDGAHYLEVDDLTGRKLKWIEFTGTQYQLSAQDLAKGIYFIRAFDNNKNVIGTSKIVVQ